MADTATTETGAAVKPGLRRHELRKQFLQVFKAISPNRRRFQVFSDFVTLSALSLANGILADEKREAEYLEIIQSYGDLKDRQAFAKLFALVIQMLEAEPHDVLGELYMEFEFGDRDRGQFFTPQVVSDAISRMMIEADLEQKLQERPFILLSEPACGAGGMILSFFKTVKEKGFNPQKCLWVQAIDVDRVSALMCYIQLSLWHIPAEVIVGNALTLEVREVFKTPAHHLGLWSAKLRQHRLRQDREDPPKENDFSFSSAAPAAKDETLGDQAPLGMEGESYPHPQEGRGVEPIEATDPEDDELKWDSEPYMEEGQQDRKPKQESSVPEGTQFDLGF